MPQPLSRPVNTTYGNRRHAKLVRCGAKWPGMGSMVIRIEYMRAVGVRASTGE